MNEDILSYPVTTKTADECISEIFDWIVSDRKQRYLVCANPHSLEKARTDPVFDRAIQEADLVVPDGAGIVLASRILGGSIRSRITGSDIFAGVNSVLNRSTEYSCFFLGSTEENLKKITKKMQMDFPNIRVAGTYSPPFRVEFTGEDNLLMTDAINRAKPHILWVGMTAPKQEKWIYQHRKKLDVKFIGAVGAVFDFYTGVVRRSHPLFQQAGLEWLPRLLREPSRMWRRNFVSNPSFIARVIWSRLRKR